MPVRVRVKEVSEGLCGGCDNAVLVKGRAQGGGMVQHTECSWMQKPVLMRVDECNKFLEPNRTSLTEMKQVAWLLIQDPKRKGMGFIHPEQMDKKTRAKLLDDVAERG